MTWLLGIKIYAACSLLFTAEWALAGYRLHKRREELTELDEPIRARAEELILP